MPLLVCRTFHVEDGFFSLSTSHRPCFAIFHESHVQKEKKTNVQCAKSWVMRRWKGTVIIIRQSNHRPVEEADP